VENVRLVDRYQSQKTTSGTLYVTATHLLFVDPAGKRETWVSTIFNSKDLFTHLQTMVFHGTLEIIL
jgi:hypothetical protein